MTGYDLKYPEGQLMRRLARGAVMALTLPHGRGHHRTGWRGRRAVLETCRDDRVAADPGELRRLAARNRFPKIFGFDYQTVERSLTEAYGLLDPNYRREFEDRSNKDIIPQARNARWSVRPMSSVPVCLRPNVIRAPVMVYMNRTMTDKSKQTAYDGSRLRVDYQKVDAGG